MIYKLNVPLLSECLLDGVEAKLLKPGSWPFFKRAFPVDFFKPEYLVLNNIEWDNVLIFRKQSGVPSPLHSDTSRPGATYWGINWIHNGDCLMEYWDLADFPEESVFNVPGLLNKPDAVRLFMKPPGPPKLEYFLKPGAYLINATVPHRATAFGDRYCISYRPTTADTPWNEIVNKFQNLIIDYNFERPLNQEK